MNAPLDTRPLPQAETAGFDRLLRFVVVIALIAACLRILAPFLGALIWGVIIAVTLWPSFIWLEARLGRRTWLATILTALVLVASLVLPLALIGASLAEGVTWLLEHNLDVTQLTGRPLPGWVAGIPLVGERLVAWWSGASSQVSGLFAQVVPYLKDSLLFLLRQGTAAGAALVQMLLAIVVAAILLARHAGAGEIARRLAARLDPGRGHELLLIAARTVRSVSFGVIGAAFVQAVLTTIGLAVSGVPAVGPLGFLTFLISVIQLPTLLVWAPAAFWLYSTGEIGWAIALGIYGLAIINTSDNLLRPLIISQGARLPLILIFLGVIGGLLAWGFLGLFIGPTLLAMTYTLFLGWIEASPMPAASDVPAPGPAPPAPLA